MDWKAHYKLHGTYSQLERMCWIPRSWKVLLVSIIKAPGIFSFPGKKNSAAFRCMRGRHPSCSSSATSCDFFCCFWWSFAGLSWWQFFCKHLASFFLLCKMIQRTTLDNSRITNQRCSVPIHPLIPHILVSISCSIANIISTMLYKRNW